MHAGTRCNFCIMLQLSCIWYDDCSLINCLTHSDFSILTSALVAKCSEFSPIAIAYTSYSSLNKWRIQVCAPHYDVSVNDGPHIDGGPIIL
jgi:hypothetical protein